MWTLPGRGALRIFDKAVPRTTFRKDNLEHYMMIKRSVLQKDKTILKVYVPNNRVSNYMRQEERDESTVIMGDFNTPLSEMDRSSREEINNDPIELTDTIHQLGIIDIYKPLHPTAAAATFFSSSPGTFTKID